MARLRGRITRAAALHQQAATATSAAARLLRGYVPVTSAAEHHAEQRLLVSRLRASAAQLAPGWLDAPLDALAPTTPLGGRTLPTFVRVGTAHPLDDASFPVMVPLLRAGHVAIDGDARDPRVAGLLRALLLRLLAAAPPRSIEIRIIDSAEVGATFEAFQPRPFPPVVTDQHGLRALLTEAEHWVANRTDGPETPTLLLIVASLPELTDGPDLVRIAALAKAGPAGRLHIIAAGWPPPPLTAETTQRPLRHCTQIALRNPHAWIGDPPGSSFAANGVGPGRLNAPVYLDDDPPVELVRRVCEELVGGAAGRVPAMVGVEPAHEEWRRYLAAAQRLDGVRRETTAVVAEHGAARTAALKSLAAVQSRLAVQAATISALYTDAGLLAPVLAPTQAAVVAACAAATRAGAPPVAAGTLLQDAARLVDGAEIGLREAAEGRRWRTAAILGVFAAIAVVTPLLVLAGLLVVSSLSHR